tara:strand:- start:293 stop:442 length:150 start_codon:yes stop_codon:yes gene_type:complete
MDATNRADFFIFIFSTFWGRLGYFQRDNALLQDLARLRDNILEAVVRPW